MGRLVLKFNDETTPYTNIEADEFHEDGNFVKAYKHNELVAMCKLEDLRFAYITESKV